MKSFLFFLILLFISLTNSQILTASTSSSRQISYPIRFTYIDRQPQVFSPNQMAAGMGVPGFAPQTHYNYIAFAFWSCSSGSFDAAKIWDDPLTYFGAGMFGSSKSQIQMNLRRRYNDAGIKIMISAFGSTQMPTSNGQDPVQCANKLGSYVLQNNLDGVDIDWEDNWAMEVGTGQQWLINFQKTLRSLLPNHIITHTPQAPYFKQDAYRNGAYMTIHNQVGSMIDFYNVQFYNQGDTTYTSYQKLFINSGGYFPGTSVGQIAKKGVPLNKIVVGKPITPQDASNTGFMNRITLGNSVTRAYSQLKWYAGIMTWQLPSDVDGKKLKTTLGKLLSLCAINNNCI